MTPTPSPLPVDTYLPHMRDVLRCEQALHELNLMWRMIESSAKMNCPDEAKAILPTMAVTRDSFNRLERELVSSLVNEKVATVFSDIGAKAQYVINIVVRNLYERTADVGFLATDPELCAFVAGLNDDVQAARLRLRAYRSKYTVYDEIILLDLKGNVLVQIDESTPLEGSTDAVLAQALASSSFVEVFRASDLRPDKPQALIYAKRMLHPHTGAVVGVLCLCFHFEEEMTGIFQSHRDSAGRSIMLLLDRDNRVLESADPVWVPRGAVVPVNRSAQPSLQIFAGREYLVRTFTAEGYQGYHGPPGWQGQVMVPVDIAFSGTQAPALAGLEPALQRGLLSHAQSLSPPLHDIMMAAETIRCVVWNGQVMTASRQGQRGKLKSVLEQISETGTRSDQLFSQSIHDLYDTVVGAGLQGAAFMSYLLVDLLDRNLYERSNDARWWALTPQLREALATPQPSAATLAGLNAVLDYINQLYTVYTRIVVYDRDGRIVASSHAQDGALPVLGELIDPLTLARVLALRTEQAYHVTPFAPTPLYGNQATYVYHAAIRAPHNAALVVGGIGLVFDATPEFSAMLRDGLGALRGLSALFVNRQGQVISSTDATRPVGSTLTIDPGVLALRAGDRTSRIVVHDGQYAMMGCSASRGYREFKVSDGYQDDVLALVFKPLGAVREATQNRPTQQLAVHSDSVNDQDAEFATFYLNGALFALPAHQVVEAISAGKVNSAPVGNRVACIGLLGLARDNGRDTVVWVFDLRYLMTGTPALIDRHSQVVIVRHNDQELGLLVDELQGVAQFNPAHVLPTPFDGVSDDALVRRFIKANGGQVLIQVIEIAALFKALMARDTTATVAP